MSNLYVIRDAQTGYSGDLLQAHSDGEAIAMLQPLVTELNRDNPLVKSMVANSQLWHIGCYDSDALLLTSVDRRLVRSLVDIPMLSVSEIADMEVDENA